jgi:L-asparaginase II
VGKTNSTYAARLSDRGFPLVEILRGDQIEAVHAVAGCVVTADGELVYGLGRVEERYPVRSLAKPFVAAELVRSGAADAFGFSAVELAVAAGSHDGEPLHVNAVRSILRKLELTDDDLLCGPATEGSRVVGPPIANNCSGKHAGVLGLCRHFAFPIAGYLDPEHPVQQWLLPPVMGAFGLQARDTCLLVDGCGMPIFSATLTQIALAYARFGMSVDPACIRVRSAMSVHPAYLGGTMGNLDTSLIQNTAGAVIGKVGAEGLHGDAVASIGIGIAIKVIDGNSRALGPALGTILQRFAALPPQCDRWLQAIAAAPLLNASNTPVGTIRAVPLP